MSSNQVLKYVAAALCVVAMFLIGQKTGIPCPYEFCYGLV